MKILGLIGGTTWVSTADYYRIINEEVNKRMGGFNSAKLILYSVNFAEINILVDAADWRGISTVFSNASKKLEDAGAEGIVMCANTPHKVADDVRAAVRVPLIHIAEVTAREVKRAKISRVGLLGTKFTMEERFFKDQLSLRQIETLIPDVSDREFIHETIFNELGKGVFAAETKLRYFSIIDKLVEQGAEGVVLGCTEIPLLIKSEECSVPVFVTTSIHANAAVDFALEGA